MKADIGAVFQEWSDPEHPVYFMENGENRQYTDNDDSYEILSNKEVEELKEKMASNSNWDCSYPNI